MTPSFRRGSLFVKNAAGETIRLAWEPVRGDETKKPARDKGARRALRPGTYKLTGYRILRRDDTGQEWFVSAIAPKGIRRIVIRPGRVQRIAIDPSITFGAKGNAKDGFMIQAPITGQHHAGISIYRDGKRIPMRYTVTGVDGKELESGKMNYG